MDGDNAGVDIHVRTLATTLADAATDALRAEVDLTPKPGLVDARGSGSHHDMSHALMRASADALHLGFHDAAVAATREHDLVRLRAELGLLGRESEARMLLATGGVNTHRGAIWCLGLLVSAAAAEPGRWQADALLGWVGRMAVIDDPAVAATRRSNGLRAIRNYGVAGARAEAAGGFVQIVEAGLPTLRASREAGCSERVARLNALIALMAVLDDTCVLSRAGLEGLRTTQARAARIVELGGVGTRRGARELAALEHALITLNASPGGSADLLAATLFVDALEAAARDQRSGARVAIDSAQEKPHATTIA